MELGDKARSKTLPSGRASTKQSLVVLHPVLCPPCNEEYCFNVTGAVGTWGETSGSLLLLFVCEKTGSKLSLAL